MHAHSNITEKSIWHYNQQLLTFGHNSENQKFLSDLCPVTNITLAADDFLAEKEQIEQQECYGAGG